MYVKCSNAVFLQFNTCFASQALHHRTPDNTHYKLYKVQLLSAQVVIMLTIAFIVLYVETGCFNL